jgi:hypothetical protein
MTESIASKKGNNFKKGNSWKRRYRAEMLNKLCKEGERKKDHGRKRNDRKQRNNSDWRETEKPERKRVKLVGGGGFTGIGERGHWNWRRGHCIGGGRGHWNWGVGSLELGGGGGPGRWKAEKDQIAKGKS